MKLPLGKLRIGLGLALVLIGTSRGWSSDVDGRGTTVMTPSVPVRAGTRGTWTFVFTVPGRGMAAGGGIRLDIPRGWSDPQSTDNMTAGYVTANTSTGAVPTVIVTLRSIFVQCASALGAGERITLLYGSPGGGNQAGRAWTPDAAGLFNMFAVYSDMDAVLNGSAPGQKKFEPTTDVLNVVVSGAPVRLQFGSPRQSVMMGLLTTAYIFPVDSQGFPAPPLGIALTLTLSAVTVDPRSGLPSGARTSLTFFADAAGTQVQSGPVVFPAGQPRVTLRAADAAAGLARIGVAGSVGSTRFDVFCDWAVSSGITAASIDTGTPGVLTAVTLSPDGWGGGETAYVRFSLETGGDWRVVLDADQDGQFVPSPTVDPARFGSGASNAVRFAARDASGRVLGNGVYPVKIAAGSWVQNPVLGRAEFVPAASPGATLSLVVSAGVITGTIRDEGGTALASAEVVAFGTAGRREGVSGETGTYVLAGMPVGSYAVSARKMGYAVATSAVTLTGAAASTVDVTLIRGGLLRVAAVRPTGTYGREVFGFLRLIPAAGGRPVASGTVHFSLGSATLSDNGYFDPKDPVRFTPYTELAAPFGAYQVTAEGLFGLSLQAWVANGVTLAGSSPVVTLASTTPVSLKLVLSRLPSIQGMVVLTDAHFQGRSLTVPVGAEPWTAESASRSYFGGALFSTGNGTMPFDLPGAEPGVYRLTAKPEGFVAYTSPVGVTVTAEGVTPAHVTLYSGGWSRGVSLTGMVFLSGGTLSANQSKVWIQAISKSGKRAGDQVSLAGVTLASYRIGGLDAGDYELAAEAEGFSLMPLAGGQFTVTLPAGQTTALNLTLKAYTGSIGGTVAFPGDTTPDPDHVRIIAKAVAQGGGGKPPSTERYMAALTLTGGVYRYEITGLGTGIYQVIAHYFGTSRTYPFHAKSVRVTDGSATELNFGFSGTSYKIRGQVTTSSSNPLWNSIANLSSNSGTETDPNGNTVRLFRVVALPLDAMGEGGGMGKDFGAGKSGGIGWFGTVTSSTLGAAVGEFTIPNLPKGAYRVFVPGQLTLGASEKPDDPENPPEIVSSSPVVVVTDQDVTGAEVAVGDGAAVSGSIALPDSGDTRVWVRLFDGAGRPSAPTVLLTYVGGGTQSYAFARLPSGRYVVQVMSQVYAAASKSVAVESSDVPDVNFTLSRGATVKIQLRDGATGMLITSDNETQFLGGMTLYALARPWVEGGFRSAMDPATGKFVDANGDVNFRNLPAGSYDLVLRMAEMGADESSTKNYAPVVVAGVVVSDDDAAGQAVLDAGVVTLVRGARVSGTVTDKATGLPVPNMLVAAHPSNRGGGFAQWVFTRTDRLGRYVLMGLSPSIKYYSISAAPRGSRFGAESSLDMMITGRKYLTVRRDDVDVSSSPTGVDFALPWGVGTVTGTVVTADGGTLKPGMSGEGESRRGALVVLQEGKSVSMEDPLGRIRGLTDPDGTFVIEGLAPGRYRGRVLAKGYAEAAFTVTVASGTNAVGRLTLTKGGTVTGSISTPEGSHPEITEVGGVAAVTANFSEIIFGALTTDPVTRLVTAYAVEGVRPGVAYQLMFFPQQEGRDGPPDRMMSAGTVTLTLADETRTLNVVYQPAAPKFIARFAKTGNAIQLKFFATQALRNLTASDRDPTLLLSLKTGGGALSQHGLSGDRRALTAVYTPPAGESRFVVHIEAWGSAKDGATNEYFRLSQDFTFYVGYDGQGVEYISNMLGGEVKIEGEAAMAQFGMGVFRLGADEDAQVELYKVATTASGAPRFAREFYTARSYALFAKSPVLSGVFSNYYDVFLKTGELAASRSYTLQLPYDASVTDVSRLNVFYLDESTNTWKKEDTDRSVDTAGRTISVALNHASRFVVVNSDAAAISGTEYTGSALKVFNFPNPFDLQTKVVTLTKVSGGGTATITGTEIRYALPPASGGDVTFEIFNLAGERVRTLREANKPGGYYYYVEWDGRNDNGSEVASGVYVCVVKAPGATATFKLAVIK